jgi:hypothetical protein
MPRRKRTGQPIGVPKGLPYGQNKATSDAQRAIPLPQAAGPPKPQAGGGTPVPPPAADPMAAAIAAAQNMAPPGGGLGRPTERPGEALTAGLPMGAGAGPEAMAMPMFPEDTDVELDLQRAYQLNPSVELARLIQRIRERNGQRQVGINAGRSRAAQRPSY